MATKQTENNGSLALFMANNLEPIHTIKYAATTRIKDKDGNPVEWELRAPTLEEITAIEKRNTKRTFDRNTQTWDERVDSAEYQLEVACACTVFPDLQNAELQKSYGVMGEKRLLKKLLSLPGDYAQYVAKVFELSATNGVTAEDVDEAKNS